jgi:glycosyltransferase involved in cell wall biosynthesis
MLWVKLGGLWPCTTGGRVRSLQTISELSQRHQVSLITTHGPDDDPDGLVRRLPRCHSIVSVPFTAAKKGTAGFAAALVRSWMSRAPVELWRWRVPAIRQHVRTLMRRRAVDLCVADFLIGAVNVPLAGAVPAVLFEHNVEHLIWQRLSMLESSPWRRALLDLEWRKLRAREAEACRRADLTIAVSEDDRVRLLELAPDSRIVSIPTGVDTEYFAPDTRVEIPNQLVFSGSMDWRPNEDAVLYFANAILPLIRASVPDVSMTVVGRNPSLRFRDAVRRAGLEVTGTVDDVRPFIDAASVYVVPLRAGGGTRLKIFEALAMAKPVVSTTIGAEGLGLEPGRHYLVADDPAGFARAVVELLRSAERRKTLGQAGRHLVESQFSWANVALQFEAHCQEVVAAPAARQRR